MSNHTRSTNIAIFTRACWLAGFSLDAVLVSCRRAGVSESEIGQAVSHYASAEVAMNRAIIFERGAHLDRRAAS